MTVPVSEPFLPPPAAQVIKSRWRQRYAPTWSASPVERELKRLIWLYWALWLFEGALRKWIVPQLAAPLLLVRDPVALWILIRALRSGVWRVNEWTWILGFLAIVSFAATVIQGIPISVALVGLRTVLLHLPLIFVIGRVLNRDDVNRIGNQMLDLGFPMALLMVAQFLASDSSFLNVGAGVGAVQIGGVGEGKIRAPGMFSFVTGAAQYFSFVTTFWLARFGRSQQIDWGFALAGMSILIAMNVALSRTLTISCVVVFAAFCMLLLTGRVPLRRVVLLVVSAAVLVGLSLRSDVLRNANQILADRFQSAADEEGSIVTRIFSGFTIPKDALSSAGIAGKGLGVGTNMGAKLLGVFVSGEGAFILGEREWERVVGEMGLVLGFGFISWRLALFAKITTDSLAALRRGDGLSWLLVAAGGVALINGQSGQPATLGFIVISCGLAVAASKHGNPHQSRQVEWRRARLRTEQRRPT